jgi:enoyl-CoA hydratase/carnithine racemase
MDVTTYTFLDISVADHIALVKFNGADHRNRYTRDQEEELVRLPGEIEADTDIRVLLLTGAGDVFTGGAQRSDEPYDARESYYRYSRLFTAFSNLDTPIVVAINGATSSVGLTIALLGDIVVAERHVQFADPHVGFGHVAATASYEWPPSIGLARAKRYLLTGDPFSAVEAQEMGLIAEVVDQGLSLKRAMEFAEKIASLRPAAVQGTKRALCRDIRSNFASVLEHGLALQFLAWPRDAP